MKTKILNLIILTMVSVFLFNSCSQDRDNPNDLKISKRSLSDVNIGEMHNMVLSEYYDTYGTNEDLTDYNKLISRLYHIGSEMQPDLYRDVDSIQVVNEIASLIGQNGEKFNYRGTLSNVLDIQVQKGIISTTFRNFIIFEVVDSNESVEKTLQKVGSYKEKNTTTQKEKELLNVFKSILLSSEYFWNNYDPYDNYTTTGCNPVHQATIADAAGGLIGGLAGFFGGLGVGAPFVGTAASVAMSALVRDMQNDTANGGCI